MRPNLQRNTFFNRVSKFFSRAMGAPLSFAIAIGVVLVWAITGPLFHFSDSWQLVINTSTTIVTFLMVFLIQNTQNRDSQAMQLKLDELIRSTKGHNILLDLEELPQEMLDRIKSSYCELAATAREKTERGQIDTDNPEVKLK